MNMELTQDAVRTFVETYEGRLYEERLHRLMYCLELLQKANGGREIGLDFRPYMYGPYSPTLYELLEKIKPNELETRATTKGCQIVPEYISTPKGAEIPPSMYDRIQRLCQLDLSLDELRDLTKDTQPYKDTEYGTEIQFDEYDLTDDAAKIYQKTETVEVTNEWSDQDADGVLELSRRNLLVVFAVGFAGCLGDNDEVRCQEKSEFIEVRESRGAIIRIRRKSDEVERLIILNDGTKISEYRYSEVERVSSWIRVNEGIGIPDWNDIEVIAYGNDTELDRCSTELGEVQE